MRRARTTTCLPTSVSCTFLGWRSTNLTPRYSSSFLSCADSVGWLTKVRSAALPKCPVSASATKYLRSLRFIGMHQHLLSIDIVYTIDEFNQFRSETVQGHRLSQRQVRNGDQRGSEGQVVGVRVLSGRFHVRVPDRTRRSRRQLRGFPKAGSRNLRRIDRHAFHAQGMARHV